MREAYPKVRLTPKKGAIRRARSRSSSISPEKVGVLKIVQPKEYQIDLTTGSPKIAKKVQKFLRTKRMDLTTSPTGAPPKHRKRYTTTPIKPKHNTTTFGDVDTIHDEITIDTTIKREFQEIRSGGYTHDDISMFEGALIEQTDRHPVFKEKSNMLLHAQKLLTTGVTSKRGC